MHVSECVFEKEEEEEHEEQEQEEHEEEEHEEREVWVSLSRTPTCTPTRVLFFFCLPNLCLLPYPQQPVSVSESSISRAGFRDAVNGQPVEDSNKVMVNLMGKA